MIKIRKVVSTDLNNLKTVLDTIELFPSDMLDDMIADYLHNPTSEDGWFTAIQDEKPCAIAYYAPEKLTDRTFNLYAIGVQNDLQNQGVGKALMAFIEDDLRNKGGRVLIVETSSAPEFEATQAFYTNIAYTKAAIIPDFWQDGEDKIVFWKKL